MLNDDYDYPEARNQVRAMVWLCAVGFAGLLTVVLLEWMS